MTRINAGINPKRLTDQHLIAEHREIKRICELFRSRMAKGLNYESPIEEFGLGKGHVLFFIDKPKYTYDRYHRLYQECLRRGFNITSYHEAWDVYWDYLKEPLNIGRLGKLLKDPSCEWSPAKAHIDLVTKRILERINLGNLNEYRYEGKKITQEEAALILQGKLQK